MLLHIVARGKIGRSPEADLVERYLKRIAWPTKVTELPERAGKPPEASPATVTIVLDERGKALSAATLFEFDEVIDPAETRKWIMAGLRSVPVPPRRSGKKLPWIDTW